MSRGVCLQEKEHYDREILFDHERDSFIEGAQNATGIFCLNCTLTRCLVYWYIIFSIIFKLNFVDKLIL